MKSIIDSSSGHFNLEIIVIDDYSATYCPKELIDLIYEIGGNYIRLPKNSGCVSIPRNIGIANTNSEYIAHIDDDVMVLPNKFKALLMGFKEGIDLVYAGSIIESIEGNIQYTFKENWVPTNEDGYGVDGSQFIYRRAIYEKVPLHFAMRGCDWELAKRVFRLNNFKGINTPVSVYKWHGGNRSLDAKTKSKEIFPVNYSSYFNKWGKEIEYTPIPAA